MSQLDRRELTELIHFGQRAVLRAGRLILSHFDADITVDMKEDRSPVTIADRRAEEQIREMIERELPGHGCVGEEHGQLDPGADYVWIVDPIDGTDSFIRGVPLFGTLLGLQHRGEYVLGVVGFPALGILVWGAQGLGAFEDGRPIRARPTRRLAEATLCTTSRKLIGGAGWDDAFQRLQAACLIDRGWGDCYGHFLVARGRVDLMLDVTMKPWDMAALVPILREAGATVTDLRGGPIVGADTMLSACTTELHRAALEHIAPASPALTSPAGTAPPPSWSPAR